MEQTATEGRLAGLLRAAHHEVIPPPSAEEIARRLYTARLARGWTQVELAAAAGVSRNVVIGEMEAGIDRERNPLTLVRLARALGQAWDWLGATAPATIPPGPGRALYSARLARAWTLAELAQAAGVSPSTIYKLEHGRIAGKPRTWGDLARALGVDDADLRAAVPMQVPPSGVTLQAAPGARERLR